jgi:sialate O-acetylesterase
MKHLRILFLLCLPLFTNAQIPFRLPAIISSHAVLQQSSDVKLWGWGPGSWNVAVVCSWSPNDTVLAKIGADCSWTASIKTPGAGGPFTVKFICGKKETVLEDIMTGEVWLFSGQSNMEWKVRDGVTDAPDVYKNCSNDRIRFFEVEKDFDSYPKSDCKGSWKVCDSASIAGFSAVGYFFGKNIYASLGVPMGLIGSYWGGTNIGSWCSEQLISQDPALQRNNREGVFYAPQSNCVLYNAMIVPLLPYRLAGACWYQGESNVWTEPETYGNSLTGMINSWRKDFETDFPFYIVQIAPWSGYSGDLAARLREQEELVARTVPGSGMVAVGDLVVNEVKDIHPKTKAAVGSRLANLALREVYRKGDLKPYFPVYQSVKFEKGKAIITVKSLEKLNCRGKEINGFAVAGDDKIFKKAVARIEKDGSIIVFSKEVQTPVSVRYCFDPDGIPNLFDSNGLPLLPFRTDSW